MAMVPASRYFGRPESQRPGTREIQVAFLDGRVFDLQVEPETTISTLKSRIRDLTGAPIYQQLLSYNGHLLHDDERLDRACVSHLATLHLVLRPSRRTIGNTLNTHTIFIKTLLPLSQPHPPHPSSNLDAEDGAQDEEITTLKVKPYTTLDAIKWHIQDEKGIPYWRQVIHFNGKVLRDEGRSLLSYEVFNGAILGLSVIPRRGWM
jgi:hypothetical protein